MQIMSNTTHSTPTGDRVQRYEVCMYPGMFGEDVETVLGWHEKLDGAQQMAVSIVLHPMVREAWVIDRENHRARVYETRKPTR